MVFTRVVVNVHVMSPFEHFLYIILREMLIPIVRQITGVQSALKDYPIIEG